MCWYGKPVSLRVCPQSWNRVQPLNRWRVGSVTDPWLTVDDNRYNKIANGVGLNDIAHGLHKRCSLFSKHHAVSWCTRKRDFLYPPSIKITAFPASVFMKLTILNIVICKFLYIPLKSDNTCGQYWHRVIYAHKCVKQNYPCADFHEAHTRW
jgi:hypothetical protein